MKKIFLYLAIFMSFATLLHSCSTDSELVIENKSDNIDKQGRNFKYNSKSTGIIPANSSNPFDTDGRMLYEQKSLDNSKNFLDGNVIPKTTGIETLTVSSSARNHLQEIIATWEMTPDAKLSFSHFIDSLLDLIRIQEQYETLYNFIVDYEENVLLDDNLSTEDKESLLINSSIIRYATYEASIKPPKNKDPDWTILFREVSSSKNVVVQGLK
jgi:hypothetical protein